MASCCAGWWRPCIGLLLAFTGANQFTGDTRFTGGIDYLWEGLPLVPTLTGLFAISQMIELALKGGSVAETGGRETLSMKITASGRGVLAGVQELDRSAARGRSSARSSAPFRDWAGRWPRF